MTEKLRQSLSAAIDDEADAFELRRVLDELGRDDELRALWDRYHLIGDVIRGDASHLSSGLRERVWGALDASLDERLPEQAVTSAGTPVPVAAATPRSPSRAGRYTGLAVAASVAFAVVIGFSGLDFGDEAPLPAVAGNDTSARSVVIQQAAPTVLPDSVPGSASGEVSPSDVQRAHAYMLHHAQQQALNQAGVMSFVKLATYEAP